LSFGVYLHIPFCLQKCNYCDFYSLGHCDSVPKSYITALLRDIKRWQTHPLWRRPTSVYFGGGTPSLLQPRQVECLLKALDPAPAAEITLEANPGTVDEAKLSGYYANGVNRLSVGVQTADDRQLKTLGRIHTAQQAAQTLRDAVTAGFTNISGDVMLALPDYSLQELTDTLQLLADSGVTHISSYLLKLEPDTPFGRHPPHGLPDEEAAADFYLSCVRRCEELGYRQYEISNFALPGMESKHNLCYWQCEDYLGLGPAAHSCLGGKRFYYPGDRAAFEAGGEPVPDGQCTVEDYIMLQLRLVTGLNTALLEQNWCVRFTGAQWQFIRRCEKNGLAQITGPTVRLTPKGMLVQNSILCELV